MMCGCMEEAATGTPGGFFEVLVVPGVQLVAKQHGKAVLLHIHL